jgi:putative glycosyltransferase (TIGR04372 family)
MLTTTDHIQPTYWSKISHFLKRQAQQIRTGGWPIFWPKVFMSLKLLLMLPFVVPVVLIIRFLRPFIVIRFGQLISARIGHFAGNTEIYLCERDAGINVPRRPYVDIWYHMTPVCNMQLKKMWDRTLHVIPFDISLFDRLNCWLPGGQVHGNLTPNHDRDVRGLMDSTPPHLSFTADEEQIGKTCLKDLGIPEGVYFVCFHARDPAYLKTIYQNFDTSYHDYRDSNIHNYVLAAGELARRGYYTIRMGAVVAEALNTSNPKIIDYSINGKRSDFMDIFLGAKCAFFISSGTGIDAIPMIFRRPHIYVNLVPIEYGRNWHKDHLFIPKKHWLCKKHRFMTFYEILDCGAGRFLFNKQFEQCGIELIENTPEEIAALAVEMDDRLKGTWQTSEEDEELQHRFWTLFKPSELNGVFRARIGAEFLRQHRDWLQ